MGCPQHTVFRIALQMYLEPQYLDNSCCRCRGHVNRTGDKWHGNRCVQWTRIVHQVALTTNSLHIEILNRATQCVLVKVIAQQSCMSHIRHIHQYRVASCPCLSRSHGNRKRMAICASATLALTLQDLVANTLCASPSIPRRHPLHPVQHRHTQDTWGTTKHCDSCSNKSSDWHRAGRL